MSKLRIPSFMAAALLLLCGLAAAGPRPVHAAPPPAIGTHAKAAAVIDVASGRVLYSSQGDTRMKIASLTKIMTAIVAIEQGRLTDVVKVGPRAVGKEGSSIYLKLGEEMSLENMLYGLMLRSGNDAATAIAEHVGGSEEGFVYLMNEKAEWLGLRNTHFANPHGLDQPEHYSSANDLARLTAYALHQPVFREIVKTKVKSAPNPNETWNYTWLNKNKMLRFYEGADGVKTGYTKGALRCLVSSATRDGQQLAVVTLNDGDDWADHRNLLDWGFRSYPLVELAVPGRLVEGFGVEAADTFRYPLADGERAAVSARVELQNEQTASFRLGDTGRLIYSLNGEEIGSVPVRPALAGVPSGNAGLTGSVDGEAPAAAADRPAFAGTAARAGAGYAAGMTLREAWPIVLRSLFA